MCCQRASRQCTEKQPEREGEKGKVWVDFSADLEAFIWQAPAIPAPVISPVSHRPPFLSFFAFLYFFLFLQARALGSKRPTLQPGFRIHQPTPSGWAVQRATWLAKPSPRPTRGRRVSPWRLVVPKCLRCSRLWSGCRRPLGAWRSPGTAASFPLESSLWWSVLQEPGWPTPIMTCLRLKWCQWCYLSWVFCCCWWPPPVGLSTRRREGKRKREARSPLSSVPCEAHGENSDRNSKAETYPGLEAQELAKEAATSPPPSAKSPLFFITKFGSAHTGENLG